MIWKIILCIKIFHIKVSQQIPYSFSLVILILNWYYLNPKITFVKNDFFIVRRKNFLTLLNRNIVLSTNLIPILLKGWLFRYLKGILVGVSFWLSGLKLYGCHCCSSGCCCGIGSVSGPVTSTCHGWPKKIKNIKYLGLNLAKSI